MTLFRQLLISVSAVFLLVLGGIEAIQVINARNYLQEQLESHSQDAATALGLSLATALGGDDPALAETVIGPVFDRGFYESIRVLDAKGKVFTQKNLPRRPPEVPLWFAQLIALEAPTTESLISAQWRVVGRVIVTSHPNFAYQQLWRTTLETLWLLLAMYVLALLAVGFFLNAILGRSRRSAAPRRRSASATSSRSPTSRRRPSCAKWCRRSTRCPRASATRSPAKLRAPSTRAARRSTTRSAASTTGAASSRSSPKCCGRAPTSTPARCCSSS
jgi:hypothetical protein